MSDKSAISELRKEITKVTLEIFRLCGERLQLAKKMGEVKVREDMPIESLEVEQKMRREVLDVCRTYGMDTGFCLRLLGLMLDESKRIQREIVESRSKNRE